MAAAAAASQTPHARYRSTPSVTTHPLATICCMYLKSLARPVQAVPPVAPAERTPGQSGRTAAGLQRHLQAELGRARHPVACHAGFGRCTDSRHFRLHRFCGRQAPAAGAGVSVGAGLGTNPLSPLVIDLAATVELIHTATLLHDDDVVDESDLRRGRHRQRRIRQCCQRAGGRFFTAGRFRSWLAPASCACWSCWSEATNRIAEGEVMQLMALGRLDLSEADLYAGHRGQDRQAVRGGRCAGGYRCRR